MKSIFDAPDRKEVLQRISSLSETSRPQWGKMTVAQMVKHCSLCEDYYFGNIVIGRSILGRLIGQKALRSILKDEQSVIARNAPTSPHFIIRDADLKLNQEKERWISLVEKYESYDHPEFVHWFFGPMTKAQLGQFIYKHCDHHLRQFGA